MFTKILRILGVQSNQFQYFVGDPTQPDISIIRSVSDVHNSPPFKMLRDHKNCQFAVSDTITSVQKYLSGSGRSLDNWAAVGELAVNPRAGNNLFNAFYNRKGLSFFCGLDRKDGRSICMANSPDVVSHETGHAILDALRPDLWNVQSAEIWAFHEAFADVIAIQSVLQHAVVVERVLAETNGDIGRTNMVSKLGEEVGISLGLWHHCIRDASTKFVYADPSTLPTKAPEFQLSSECHSFGRVFLGMWYDMMVAIYNQLKLSTNNVSALEQARDIAARYLIRACLVVPKTPQFFKAMAETMLAADRADGGMYSEIMRQVFVNRHVLTNEIKTLSTKKIKIDNCSRENTFRHNSGAIVAEKNTVLVKLSDYYATSLSNSSPYHHCQIEIPLDDGYDVDSDGNLVNEIISNREQSMNAAALCVAIISKNNRHLEQEPMWRISENRLFRNFVED
jgi:hypothetical protein